MHTINSKIAEQLHDHLTELARDATAILARDVRSLAKTLRLLKSLRRLSSRSLEKFASEAIGADPAFLNKIIGAANALEKSSGKGRDKRTNVQPRSDGFTVDDDYLRQLLKNGLSIGGDA